MLRVRASWRFATAATAAQSAVGRGVEVKMTFGYIDPGSGSLVIQAIIASLVALPFFFKRQLARVVSVVRRDEEVSSRRR